MITKANSKKSLVGEMFLSSEGDAFRVVGYVGNRYYRIVFDHDEHFQIAKQNHIKNGNIKNKHHRNIFNIGYCGIGDYKTKTNGKHTKEYLAWRNMLKRCYDDHPNARDMSYKDCEVCERWHNFQNFAKWYEENYYEVEGETMSIDKDILVKGNKVYSPETCCIVPLKINTFFSKYNGQRGDMPTGVFVNDCGNYKVMCSNMFGEERYYGTYQTSTEAETVYKKIKNSMIDKVVEEYALLIPARIIQAIKEWKY